MTEEEKKLLQEQQSQTQTEQPSYSSPWQSQLEDTWKKIQEQPNFQYDVNADALWNQYKDQYIRQGQMAMEDTMGQAQAMTGGYGNSYAQSVGQQTYQGYLQGLNDNMPQFIQMAQDQHKAENDRLLTEYGILSDLESKDYSRWQDEQAQRNWQTEWDEYIRRYNYENQLGEFAPTGGGSEEERTVSAPQDEEKEQPTLTKAEQAKLIHQSVARGEITQNQAQALLKQIK